MYFCNRFQVKTKVFIIAKTIGAWRSWLAHLHGVQGVGSSSLLAPTEEEILSKGRVSFLFCPLFSFSLALFCRLQGGKVVILRAQGIDTLGLNYR